MSTSGDAANPAIRLPHSEPTKKYPSPATYPAFFISRVLYLPDDRQIIAAIKRAISIAGYPEFWTDDGVGDDVAASLALRGVLWMDRIGEVFYAIYEPIDAPPWALPCDGRIVARDNYPRLYEASPSALIVDADNVQVPDLRDRFALGAGGINSAHQTGGEAEHTLTVDEMPSHSHSEGIASPTVINGGLEAPANSAVPATAATGATGGGQAHNNMPPWYGLQPYIVAR